MALFDHFPREIDMRTRKVIHNKKQLEHYIKTTNGKGNLTTTVYGFRDLKTKGNRCEYNTAIIPHFVMDFDADQALRVHSYEENLAKESCCKEVETISSELSTNNIQHAIWFTGGGFHIWVKLDQEYILPPNKMSDLLFSGRMIINQWVKTHDLKTLDPVVSFRPDRHIRIPNTYNFKRQIWGIPVWREDLMQGWNYIVTKAQEPAPGMNLYEGKGMSIKIIERDSINLFDSSNSVAKSFEAGDIEIDIERINNIPMLPCLAQAACEKGSNPPHKPRSYLMMYLMDYFRNFARPPRSSTVSNQEVLTLTHAFIRSLEWADYKPSETSKYLTHGVERYYLTPTCPTIYHEGLCVGKCPYYDEKGATA
tara:strand:+ start:17334 stop:18431 length:1098 start_codon:yes stop_codon:yes gene_type:complete